MFNKHQPIIEVYNLICKTLKEYNFCDKVRNNPLLSIKLRNISYEKYK